MRRRASALIGVTLALAIGACGVSSSTILETIPDAPAPAPGVPGDMPALPVVPLCIGIPIQQCRDMATTAFWGGTHADVIRITVRCNAVCTPRSGAGETRIEYRDGSNEITTWGYSDS